MSGALKATTALLVGAIIASELASRAEQQSAPVVEGKTVLPYKTWRSPSEDTPRHLLVFLHGWPDDLNLFAKLATRLSSKYVCVSCNLPGYPLPPGFDGTLGTVPPRTWGFTFKEAVTALKSTIEKLMTEGGFESVTLVTHDWGAVVGYLLDDAYPELVQRMLSLDVGWRMKGATRRGSLFILAYQGYLNICFLLPRFIGAYLTQRISRMFGRIPAQSSGPVSSSMNWPYRAAWRDMFTGGMLRRMNKYRPSPKPRMFLYAIETPAEVRFSDEKWYAAIEGSCVGVSKVQGVRGGHWMMNKNETEVSALIEDWLEMSQDHTDVAARSTKGESGMPRRIL